MLKVIEMTDAKQVLKTDRLIQARKRMQFSQVEFARRLDIDGPHMNKIEKGVHQPSLDLVVKMAILLDISIDYLVGVTDNPEGDLPKVLTPEQEAMRRIERAELEIAAAKRSIRKSIEKPGFS